MQHCSGSGGIRGLDDPQFAFPRDALVRFVHAFYAVFKFTAALGHFLYDFIRAAGGIATDRRGDLYELTDVKFVCWHGGALQTKAQSNVPRKNNAMRRVCKSVTGWGSKSPRLKVGGSAGRAYLDYVLGGCTPRGAPFTVLYGNLTSLFAVWLPNALIVPNDPSVLRFRRLWPFLLTSTQARKISLGENGRRGEAPKCIYSRAALLEQLGYCWRPFELSP